MGRTHVHGKSTADREGAYRSHEKARNWDTLVGHYMADDYRHNAIFDFMTYYYILHSNEFFVCLNFMLVLPHLSVCCSILVVNGN